MTSSSNGSAAGKGSLPGDISGAGRINGIEYLDGEDPVPTEPAFVPAFAVTEPAVAAATAAEPAATEPVAPEPAGETTSSLPPEPYQDPHLDPHLDPPEDYSWVMTPTTVEPVIDLPPVTVRRRRMANAFGLVIGLVVALVVALTALALMHSNKATPQAGSPVGSTGGAAPGAGGTAAGGATQHTVTGPLGATQAAEFELDSGVTTVIVRTVDLGDTLYRAVTPDPSGFVPRVAQDAGKVRLQLAKVAAGDGTDTVVVELNTRVRWQVSLVGGSASATVDLRGASVAGVDFAGGVDRIELWVPSPHGAEVVRMSGGAREMVVHAPQGVPVRVGLGKGSAKVTVDGAAHNGVAAGTHFLPTGWEAARDRYDLDAAGGVGALTVDRY